MNSSSVAPLYTFKSVRLSLISANISRKRSRNALISAFHNSKTLLLLTIPLLNETLADVQQMQGEFEPIVPLRVRLWAGGARAAGPGSAGLLLCSSYVCQGCLGFHMERQGTGLGEHSTAGKWAVRKWTIIQNRAPTKEGLQMCWL